jgi:hypothetical protein
LHVIGVKEPLRLLACQSTFTLVHPVDPAGSCGSSRGSPI